jgi:hypothetical protein
MTSSFNDERALKQSTSGRLKSELGWLRLRTQRSTEDRKSDDGTGLRRRAQSGIIVDGEGEIAGGERSQRKHEGPAAERYSASPFSKSGTV